MHNMARPAFRMLVLLLVCWRGHILVARVHICMCACVCVCVCLQVRAFVDEDICLSHECISV